MGIDLESARQFIESTARVLERHRFAVLSDDGPTEPVLTALRAYQNADGGFGHALEPDVRCPGSQPSAALFALEVLADVDAVGDPMVTQVAGWIASIAHLDGHRPPALLGDLAGEASLGVSPTSSYPPGSSHSLRSLRPMSTRLH